METIIQVEGLKKYYKEIRAVDGISFRVKRGELFGFLGVNGAGKTTTINMLCTLYEPTAGEIEICGFKAGREDENIRRKIGVVWQGNCLDDRLTVRENLMIRGSLYGQKAGTLKDNVCRVGKELQLTELFDRPFGKLSGGQKRRCEVAAALVNTPEILFLDEPTTGLDPATRQMVWERLEHMQKEEGMTIFLTTHYMEEAARAGYIAVMDSGRIREAGTPFDLKERYAKDRLRLVPREGKREALEQLTTKHFQGNDVVWESDSFLVSVPESVAALPLLAEAKECLQGFELVQGTMDDVFLNLTGKKLED